MAGQDASRSKNALPGSRLNGFLIPPDQLVIPGIDTDIPEDDPLYDPRIKIKLEKSFIRSIGKKIHEPVLVAVDGSWQEGQPVLVVDGIQRVRAARIFNSELLKAGADEKDLIRVPCLKERYDEDELFDIKLIANEHRHEDDALAKAEKLGRWLNNHPDDHKGAAERFNCSVVQIKNYEKLLSLDKSIKKGISDGAVSASAAMEWHDLPKEKQKEAFAEAKKGSNGKRITKKKAKKTKAKTTGKEEGIQKPGMRLLRRVVIGHGAYPNEVDEKVIQTIGWILGDHEPEKIKGLTKLIRNAETMKETK